LSGSRIRWVETLAPSGVGVAGTETGLTRTLPKGNTHAMGFSVNIQNNNVGTAHIGDRHISGDGTETPGPAGRSTGSHVQGQTRVEDGAVYVNDERIN
jgi:hypothetical protein